MIELSGITFIASYNCNAHCRHCFFDTSAAYSYMSPEIIERVYEDRSVLKKMFWNHISGGEVMLEPDSLYDIIRKIRTHFSGDIGISTNGFWANSPEIAERRIQELKDAGVSGIAVSSDTFHDEFIPCQNVANVVHALSQSGLTRHSYIMSTVCNNDVLHAQGYNLLSEKLAQKVTGDYPIPFAKPAIRSIGKGSLLNLPKKKIFSKHAACTELSECLGKRGPFNPAMVYVDVYGNIMICYGIIIGNIFKTPFAQIISNFSVNQHM